jgi:hypothetical protein
VFERGWGRKHHVQQTFRLSPAQGHHLKNQSSGETQKRYAFSYPPPTMFLFLPLEFLDFETANVLWLGEGGSS